MSTTSPVPGDTAGDSSEPPASLLSLPPEVILEYVLPCLPLADLLNLSVVSKDLNALVNDPSLWRTLTAIDFSYRASSLSLAPRDDGWYKRVYIGLRRPRTFLWGDKSGHRLGPVHEPAYMHSSWVTKPMDATFNFEPPSRGRALADRDAQQRERDTGVDDEATGVVELVAGGWSFAARDARGAVWVWGRLDGRGHGWGVSWDNTSFAVEEPTPLPLPCRAAAIASGRQHLVVLDDDNLVWEMRSYGRAYRHTAPELTAPSSSGARAPGRAAHIKQVTAGWQLTAALTAEGTVYVWFPLTTEYKDACTPEDELNTTWTDGDDDERIPKLKWGTVGADVVHTLLPLPDRPPVPEDDPNGELAALEKQFEKAAHGWTDAQRDEKERIVTIACGQDYIVALRGNGEVWAMDMDRRDQWEYMAHFSSPSITHITAQYSTLTTYSTPAELSASTSVLFARVDHIRPGDGPNLRPQPLPGLDGLPVVQVVAGDWHMAALTAKGEMFTWGENACGQLGLATPPSAGARYRSYEHVDAPTRVPFPQQGGRNAFVFAITAAGMQTGALVLGHGKPEPPKHKAPVAPPKDDDSDEFVHTIRGLPMRGGPLRGGFPFRIGFAGRGTGSRFGAPGPRGG